MIFIALWFFILMVLVREVYAIERLPRIMILRRWPRYLSGKKDGHTTFAERFDLDKVREVGTFIN